MTTASLPSKPNLLFLRKLAKEVLESLKSNDAAALKETMEILPKGYLTHGHSFSLSDVQFVIARRYGFESWPKLVKWVESSQLSLFNERKTVLKAAIQDLQEGKLCILFDDEGRENEGDFIFAAEKVSAEAINFITKFGRGTLCLSMTETQRRKLGLNLINSNRTNLAEPAFLTSIDASNNIATGVSAHDRAYTIKTAVSDEANPFLVKSPGHVFPLVAHQEGIHARPGHTEGSIELVRRAGLKPAAVISEILNEDGTMARWPDLQKVAEYHRLQIVRMSDLFI